MRPANVILLTEEIAAAMAREATLTAITRDIPVHLTNSALEAMRVEGRLASTAKAAEHLFRELNEICAVDEHVDRVPRSEEHTSELQSLMRISYAAFFLKKKNT